MNLKIMLAASVVVCAACAQPGPASEPTPLATKKGNVQQVSNNGFSGRWTAEIVMPEAEPKDPSQKMALEMAKAFANSIWLELRANGTFMLSMILPIEGTWKHAGNKIDLKPTSFMGMSSEELKKKAKESGEEFKFESEEMSLEISADGKTLHLKSDKPEEGELIFKRQD
jgi:hypothetical protein